MKRAVLLVATLTALAGLGACDKKRGQPVGIGNYKFGHTTRADIYDGICQPTELNDGRKATWCFALPPVKIGQRVADVDAYFLGQETEANSKLPEKERKPALEKLPLLEVQFKIRGCVESEAEQWIRQRFGPQDVKQSVGALAVWQNDFIWIGAFLPVEHAKCLIHFLPKSEAAEIERIKAKARGETPAPAPATDTPAATPSGSAGSGSAQ